MSRNANYLTDFRDRFAGKPGRALHNIAGVVAGTIVLVWALSSFDLVEPPSAKSFFGSAIGAALVAITAWAIRFRWPQKPE